MPSQKGPYTEYLDLGLTPAQVNTERKKQLARIAELRGRDVLVYAADASKATGARDVAITSNDLLPFNDQLSVLNGEACDVVLETPGGSAETVEDMVKLLREKFSSISFIIPGRAMSAGTIMVMSGDEILMEPASSLGPIDAQIERQGRRYSAHAFLKGLEDIKADADKNGYLNRAYIPILQAVSPGDIELCNNAQALSRTLVSNWLATYKFRGWTTHSKTGQPVTPEERKARADQIAATLGNHSYWMTHGRSVKIEHLQKEMQLIITDYSTNADLCDAIRRYHILLQMTFESTAIYKIFETPHSQIYRQIITANQGPGVPKPGTPASGDYEIKCPKCGTPTTLQANFGKSFPLRPGRVPFPQDGRLKCSKCSEVIDVTAMRENLEAQVKLPIV